MIVDWNGQCKKIHESKMLSEFDSFDRRYKFRQEILYVNFLTTVLNLSKEECFKEWSKIKNGSYSTFLEDEELAIEQFNHIYNMSELNKYKKFDVDKQMQPINIYAGEINYLNRLVVPKWVKQYWLCLLIYYKFASQVNKSVYKNKNISWWAIQKSDFKSKNYGGDCQDKIANYKNSIDKDIFEEEIFVDKGKIKFTYKPCFIRKNGKRFYQCQNINEIDEILSKIKNTKVKCPKCGKRHEISSYSKTFLCPNCYKKDLKDRNNIAKKKCRQKDKETGINKGEIKDCPILII